MNFLQEGDQVILQDCPTQPQVQADGHGQCPGNKDKTNENHGYAEVALTPSC